MGRWTRRSFVCAAGGLGALTYMGSLAARAGQLANNTTAAVRVASASVKLTDDNMQELHAKEKVFSQRWQCSMNSTLMTGLVATRGDQRPARMPGWEKRIRA